MITWKIDPLDWKEIAPSEYADLIAAAYRALHPALRPCTVLVDTVGLGGGVLVRLLDLGVPAVEWRKAYGSRSRDCGSCGSPREVHKFAFPEGIVPSGSIRAGGLIYSSARRCSGIDPEAER